MPKYFFHRTDGFVGKDREGTDLPNHRHAQLEALKYAGECLSEDPEILWEGQEFRVEVTDETGNVQFTVIVLTVDAPSQRRRLKVDS